jgi:hypothetical protein
MLTCEGKAVGARNAGPRGGANKKIFTHPCGYSGPATSFGWPHASSDNCGQDYKVARSSATADNNNSSVCSGPIPWVDCTFWRARYNTSDRGPQFSLQLWAELCQLLNIKLSMTTAYHSEANGMVERMHRRLKDALRTRATSGTWLQNLLLGDAPFWGKKTPCKKERPKRDLRV